MEVVFFCWVKSKLDNYCLPTDVWCGCLHCGSHREVTDIKHLTNRGYSTERFGQSKYDYLGFDGLRLVGELKRKRHEKEEALREAKKQKRELRKLKREKKELRKMKREKKELEKKKKIETTINNNDGDEAPSIKLKLVEVEDDCAND